MTEREKVIKGLEYHLKELTAGKTCYECPYCGDNPCEIQLIANALALLKDAEPSVLTYEETDTIAHQTEETAIYLERKSDKSLYAAIAGDTQGRVPNISWLGKERNYPSEYGISWRCWSARPTDEQREATPWET